MFFSENKSVLCTVELFEKGPQVEKVAEIASCNGSLKLENPKPWWPYLMTDNEPGNISFLSISLPSINFIKSEIITPPSSSELVFCHTEC